MDLELEKFRLVKSSTSSALEDIEGFILGGASSRFWVLRKHINNLSTMKLLRLPFHSWNCITLQLKNREVDLVIKNEKQMKIFIKFLVYSIQTIDGQRGTALPVVAALTEQTRAELTQATGRAYIQESRMALIRQQSAYQVYKKVCLKISIMTIRAKISF